MKIIIILFITLCIEKTVGQTRSDPILKDYYLQKSKTQKKTAWILLTGGTIMAVAGAIGFDDSWDSDSYTKTDIFGFVTLVGVVADIASIPFFISAAKNKRKWLSVAISNPKIFVPPQKAYALNTQPTFTLKFRL